jgi:hypothetical protein
MAQGCGGRRDDEEEADGANRANPNHCRHSRQRGVAGPYPVFDMPAIRAVSSIGICAC